jgi:cyclopropane-fatty-acyl-phospholipid synthase
MVPIDAVSIEALRGSDAWSVALMQHQFPGSFLPFGAEQVIRVAEPYSAQWSVRADAWTTSRRLSSGMRGSRSAACKTWPKARLVARYLTSRESRLAFTSRVSATTVCFERELLDRFRLVFEK